MPNSVDVLATGGVRHWKVDSSNEHAFEQIRDIISTYCKLHISEAMD